MNFLKIIRQSRKSKDNIIANVVRIVGQIVVLPATMLIGSHALGDCTSADVDLTHLYSKGWGFDAGNTRFQTDTRINRTNVGRLKLQWAVSLGKLADHHAQPLVTADTVFIGTQEGALLALDRETGCERFVRQFDSDIRTAIVHHLVEVRGRPEPILLFGTGAGSVYAITARDGEVLWRVAADVHPHTRITGTPAIAGETLYVPVSSFEAAVAAGPTYSCCTFRGSILALDIATGTRKWRSYSIDEPARITGTRLLVLKERGPSGAPIWSTPTIAEDTQTLYYGTGENYSLPATPTSDAIIAISLVDGSRRWVSQFTAGDVWNISCDMPLISANCPDKTAGVDLDFGAPPILTTSRAHGPILIAGQKSGAVYAIDPDSGSTLWQQGVGRGGKLGGVHWGMAVNPSLNLVYVPISDRITAAEVSEPARPGLHALDLDTGTILWSTLHMDDCSDPLRCDSGLSAAITATPDLVFAGSLDGKLRAYDATTGDVIWSFSTAVELRGVNNEQVVGGAIDVHGPMVAGDWVFVTSGYGAFLQKSGNAFLAFRLDDGDNNQ